MMRDTNDLKMTVADVIKALHGLDPEDQVYVRNPSGGFVSYDPLIMVRRCDLEPMEGFEMFGRFPLLVTNMSADDDAVATILDEAEAAE